MPTFAAKRAGQLKGPEDRIAELQALRAQVLQKKYDPKAGYDPKMQLQDIDHELARLTE